MMAEFFSLFEPTLRVFGFIFQFWWIWLGPLSITLFLSVFRTYRQNIYKNAIEWTLFEIRMPREIEKSPKAMEQFLATVHGLYNAPNDIGERYWEGQVTLWYSLELVSLQGDIHFYIHTPSKYKKIIQANLYANYPTVEIEQAEDYMDQFPETFSGLQDQGYDLWGSELVLAKEDAYPIRTYLQFENIEEAMALDPIAGLLEVLSSLEPGENIAIQLIIRPTKDDWKIKAEKLVDELKHKGSKTIVGPIGEYTDRPIRTPGETDILKAIEANVAKSGFETIIRYIYMAHQSRINPDFGRRAITSAFNQYSAQNLNSFMRNPKITTDVRWPYFPWVLTKQRLLARKRRMFANYRKRVIPETTFISKLLTAHFLHLNMVQRVFVLNTEELATLYHPPTNIVLTGQLLDRVGSKKLGPPSGLPIFQQRRKEITE